MDILWGTTSPRMRFDEALARAPAIAAVASPAGPAAQVESGGLCLAASSSAGHQSAHREDAWMAAIVGRPTFDLPHASELARRQGAAAALLTLYREQGARAVQHVHGTFTLAVADTASRSLFFALDRIGAQTLCYGVAGGELVLGSTADLVAAHPLIGWAHDPQAIFNYLFFHTVPAPGSIYRGVQKLLPGECASFRDGRLAREFYWRMPYRDDNRESFADLSHEFRGILGDAVARESQADHIGAFLSGGTDSSTVSGLLTQISGRPAETYSIGFRAEGFDETEYARIAARHFGTHPHEYYVTPDDVVKILPVIARAYDEPFGNASAVPTYYCAKRAREDGISVMLAGDGGDELFGGNARYAKQKVFELYAQLPAALKTGLIEPLAFHVPALRDTGLFKKAQSYIQQANVPLPDRLESYNFLARTPLADIFEPDFLAATDAHAPIDLMREVYGRTDSHAAVNRMMHLDLKLILADNDLRKVGRMCDLAGVEARYPLLDEKVMAFSAKLTPAYKVKGYKLRWFFKEALNDFLPQEILTKRKHGFGLPFGLWMQQHPPLQQLAYDSLAAFRRRGYVKPAYLDHLVDQHRTGHASYYGVMIWVLMMLELWLAARDV